MRISKGRVGLVFEKVEEGKMVRGERVNIDAWREVEMNIRSCGFREDMVVCFDFSGFCRLGVFFI